MRTITDASGEEWVREYLDGVNKHDPPKHSISATALNIVPWRRGTSFGWLKQQSLLRQRKGHRVDGAIVKQRLFRWLSKISTTSAELSASTDGTTRPGIREGYTGPAWEVPHFSA